MHKYLTHKKQKLKDTLKKTKNWEMDGICLSHVFQLKLLRYVWDISPYSHSDISAKNMPHMPGISEKSVWGTANFDQTITFNNNLLTAHTTISEASIEFINLKSNHRF